jgi:hypothetical protein
MFDQMHDSEVLSRAMDGDSKAVFELLHRQQHGRAQRLYPYGRRGAEDEGVMPLAMRVDGVNLVITQGCAMTILFFEHDWGPWLITSATLMNEAIVRASHDGMPPDEIVYKSEQGATRGLQVYTGVDPAALRRPAAIGCAFYPAELTEWRLSVHDVRQFLCGIMDAAHRLCWQLDADEEEQRIVDTFCQ